MYVHLGEFVAGPLDTGSRLNGLTKPIEKATLDVLDSSGENFVAEAQRREFPHRMRKQRDSDAQFLDLRSARVNVARYAALVQIQRKRQTADTAPDDCDVHNPPSPLAFLMISSCHIAAWASGSKRRNGVNRAAAGNTLPANPV